MDGFGLNMALITPDNAMFKYSPGNWKGDSGRTGSSWRQSWNLGAYFFATWSAGPTPTATIKMTNASTSAMVSYYLNGVLVDNVAANADISISNIVANTTNNIIFYVRSSPITARWNNGANTVKFSGITLDAGSSAGTAPVANPWVLMVGDSITEGYRADNGSDSTLSDYSFLVGQALFTKGYDYCVSACGSSGYLDYGDSSADVPPYYDVISGTYQVNSRWNKIDNGVSLLDSNSQISSYGSTNTTPSLIIINYGTNEYLNTDNTTDLRNAITQCVAALRGAAPTAYILIMIPFCLQNTTEYPNQAYTTAITNGVADYQSANPGDTKVNLVNYGVTLANTIQYTASNTMYMNTDGLHPNVKGHAFVAPIVLQTILNKLVTTSGVHNMSFHVGLN